MDDFNGDLSNRVGYLAETLFDTLSKVEGPLKEYELIVLCEGQGLFDFLPRASATLMLYRKHYLIMHTLYSLRPRFAEQGLWLSIAPLEICVTEFDQLSESMSLGDGDIALADYYLDWTYYKDADDDTVDRLLKEFWQRYDTADKRAEALCFFDLQMQCSWEDVQYAYRNCASRYHPDKGGNAEQFIKAREYYLVLKSVFFK